MATAAFKTVEVVETYKKNSSGLKDRSGSLA